MTQSILTHIALIVRDYDEAIAWYTGVLGFTLVSDIYQLEQDNRWVLVAPPGAGENAASFSSPVPHRRSSKPSSATRPAGVSSCS
ncbi:MAG TPA: VOC family protein [Allosphingosinicella sp.]